MNFAASVEYLYNLGNEVLAMKLGLENIGKLLNALGNPHKTYLKVQVAGTNGKGSTCAFLESICVSAGIKTGKYTSPHLISITERININGAEISEENFAEHATRVRRVSENLFKNGELETVPTFFEQVTAIALCAFAEENVELAILETGLGGRFDATTATNAEIVAITPIDYDHQHILGNTLTEIASEKAAIIREDTKVVLVNQPEEAEKVVLKRCADFGVVPRSTSEVSANLKSQISNFKTGNAEYNDVRLNLQGKHQIENAKVAILLAEILQENGFPISAKNIIEGLETAKHSGRLEFYENFLFDGAHNISGAKALREYLDESVNQPITMIFGAMKDKDLSEISEILFPKAENLILTVPDNPRSMEISELQNFAFEILPKEKIILTETVADALKITAELSNADDLILVTGSLYLVGEALKIIKGNFEI